MGLSYKYLNGMFKRETGMTALRYHTCLRMNEAARLLRETSLSVTEIADRLGYANVFYFSNVFKKLNGIPPGTMREIFLRDRNRWMHVRGFRVG